MTLPYQNVKVLAATKNKTHKAFSVLVTIPTVLLAELRTHRILTQGASYEFVELDELNLSANSARAIPHNKYIENILNTPYIPMWTKQQKGMSGAVLTDEQKQTLDKAWVEFLSGYDTQMTVETNSDTSIDSVCFDPNSPDFSGWIVDYHKPGIIDMYNFLLEQGVHKQNANRLLAPFAYTTCILSGTEWDNFFNLRCPQYDFNNPDLPDQKLPIFRSKKEARKYFKQEYEAYIEKYKHLPAYSTERPHSLAAEMNQYVNGLKGDYSDSWGDDDLDFWFDPKINKSSAQPEFQLLAEAIYDAYNEATFTDNKYHIPFEDEASQVIDNFINNGGDMTTVYDRDSDNLDDEYSKLLMKISASMCAKLSYNTQDNQDTLEKHLERANMLLEHKHWEPFSHQMVAMDEDEYITNRRTVSFFNKTKTKSWLTEKDANYQTRVLTKGESIPVKTIYGCAYNLRGFFSQRYILENTI